MSAASADPAPASVLAPETPEGWVIRRAGSIERPGSEEPIRIWGLTPEERLLRALRRAGCHAPRVVDAAALPVADRPVVALRSDVVIDERLVEGLRAAPDTLLVAGALGAVGAHVPRGRAPDLAAALFSATGPGPDLRSVTPEQLAPAYVAKLRKRETPYVLPARADLAAEVERRTFEASYKGLTDLVTRWVWPRPAAAATRWCARRGIHPNTVTLWSWVLAIAAFWGFLRGDYGAGLLCAWAMTFLDTVDGKLARVTLTSSRLGDVLDHGLDLLHPPFWWWAFGAGLGGGHAWATGVAVGGYLVGRLLEGAFLARFGFETHSWRPLDGLFRTITARRNPNLILLSVGWLGGRPDLGLVMLALWTLASLVFHAVRLFQAETRRARGAAIAPWEVA